MVKIKQTLAIVASVLLLSATTIFFSQEVSYAQQTCGGVDTSIIGCKQTGCADNAPVDANGKCPDGSKPELEDTGLWGLLMLAINILTAGIGVSAVGGIIYGAVLYTTSGGSLDQVKKALQIIQNVAIGLVMYALMYAFLNYIIPGGLFS